MQGSSNHTCSKPNVQIGPACEWCDLLFVINPNEGAADAQVGGTYWLTNLARRDEEWQVRACALGLLARLASPAAPATRRMLMQAWRDGPAIATQVRQIFIKGPKAYTLLEARLLRLPNRLYVALKR